MGKLLLIKDLKHDFIKFVKERNSKKETGLVSSTNNKTEKTAEFYEQNLITLKYYLKTEILLIEVDVSKNSDVEEYKYIKDITEFANRVDYTEKQPLEHGYNAIELLYV